MYPVPFRRGRTDIKVRTFRGGKGIEEACETDSPVIGFPEGSKLLFGRRLRFCVDIPVFTEFPCFMPLPGADAVGEDVVFKTVCFLGREIAQEEGLQETENRFLLPARILSRRLGCQEGRPSS